MYIQERNTHTHTHPSAQSCGKTKRICTTGNMGVSAAPHKSKRMTMQRCRLFLKKKFRFFFFFRHKGLFMIIVDCIEIWPTNGPAANANSPFPICTCIENPGSPCFLYSYIFRRSLLRDGIPGTH